MAEGLTVGNSGSQYLNQMYLGAAGALSGLSSWDTDLGYTSMMGMGGSVFGGLGYGFNSKSWQMYQNMTPAEQMKYNLDLQKEQAKLQTEYKKQIAGESFKVKAADTSVLRQIGTLQRAISEHGDVFAEYNKSKEAFRNKLVEEGAIPEGAIADEQAENQIKASMEEAYYNATGTSITNDIKKHSAGEFNQGIFDGLVFGLGHQIINNGKSEKDLLSEITGEEKTTGDKVVRGIGAAIGVVASALALPFVLKGGWSILKASAKGYGKLLGIKPKA